MKITSSDFNVFEVQTLMLPLRIQKYIIILHYHTLSGFINYHHHFAGYLNHYHHHHHDYHHVVDYVDTC